MLRMRDKKVHQESVENKPGSWVHSQPEGSVMSEGAHSLWESDGAIV